MRREPSAPTMRQRLFDIGFYIATGARILLSIETLAHVLMILKVELFR